jgi:hypothetical protein
MKTENKLFRITLNAAEGSAEVTPLIEHQGFTTGDAVNGTGGELSFIIGSTENPLQVLKAVERIIKSLEQELCLTSQQIWEDIHQFM